MSMVVRSGVLVALMCAALAWGCGRADRESIAKSGDGKAVTKSAATAKSSAPQGATSRPSSTQTPAPAGPYAAGVGWDVPPYARDYGLGGNFAAVGLACARGLPPGAAVSIRFAGQTGARSPAAGAVAADGSMVVAFGLERPGEIVWEFVSITPREGAFSGVLPRGRAATWGTSDLACEPR